MFSNHKSIIIKKVYDVKKYSKLIIGISIVVLTVFAVCIMHYKFSYIDIYKNLSSDTMKIKSKLKITKADKKIYQLALEEKDGLKSDSFSSTLEKKYLYVDLFVASDIVYVDLIMEDKTRVVLYEEDHVLYKYVNIDHQVFINSENCEINVFEIVSDSKDRNEYSQDIAMLDPFFKNEYSINPYSPRKSYCELIQVDYLDQLGIREKQELSVYESQSDFDTVSEKGVIYNKGTSLICIAMAQKIELKALYDWFSVNGIRLDYLQQTTSKVFFCTYKKVLYSVGRYVTCTNPLSPYNGNEVLIYEVQEKVQAELKYKNTHTINQKNNVISVEYIQDPNSVNYCDKYYKDIAIPVFNQMLQNSMYFDLWNAEKDF